MRQNRTIVAGIMSGTSADGINVALVRFRNDRSSPEPSEATRKRRSGRAYTPQPELIEHAEYRYPPPVRTEILSAMNASAASVADLARLNFLLGHLYAEAVISAQRRFRIKADLIGCHGQTLYHQGEPTMFLGRKIAATWQTGEGAVIASRAGVPVVSDFRPADVAGGGQGAPLVPFFDYIMFRDRRVGRIVQNIGGIANLTAIPPRAEVRDLIAFDTGPGNMVIDAVTEKLFGKAFDRDGKIAASGKVLENIARKILRDRFFRARPPKTAGREQFGREFVMNFLDACGNCRREDAVATATAVTAGSIVDAVKRHVIKGKSSAVAGEFREMILSGGGTKNSTLVRMLKEQLKPMRIQLRFSDELGVPSAAKESMAFALLAYETWNRRPSNVPSATGATRPAVLGKISYP